MIQISIRHLRLNILGLLLLCVIFATSVIGCSATKAYLGEDKPKQETARVYFFCAKGVDCSLMSIDGVTQGFFDMGLIVLPGHHTADVQVKLSDRHCLSYSDSYCSNIVASGGCIASFSSAGGKEYAVRVKGGAGSAYISVENHETAEIVGGGSCTISDFDVVSDRRK